MGVNRAGILAGLLAASIVTTACTRACGASRPSNDAPRGSQAAQAVASAEGASGQGAGGSAPPAAAAAMAAQPAAVSGSTGAVRHMAACALISRHEMSEILHARIGKPMGADTATTTECTYPPGQIGNYSQAHVTIEWDSPRTGPSMAHQLADAGAGTEPGARVAQHVQLGDEADWSLDGTLQVRQGPTLITIDVRMGPESRAQGTAIAEKILARLAGAPLPTAGDDDEDDQSDDPLAGLGQTGQEN